MMSREQAQAIARAVHLLRPAWNEEGIYAALAKVRDRDPFAIALAAFRAAADEKAQTPGVIPNGPHWNEKPPEERPKPSYRPPRKDEVCPAHAGSYADNCSGCRADQLAGDKTTPGDPRRPDRTEQIKTLRAELAAVKTELQESK